MSCTSNINPPDPNPNIPCPNLKMDIKDPNLIAYCGLYCGDCFFYKGEIADLARDLRKKLREARLNRTYEEFSKFAREFKNYPQIRKCAQNRGIEGCWECDEFETCQKLDFLRPNHGEAHLKNLRKIRKGGIERFLEGKRYW